MASAGVQQLMRVSSSHGCRWATFDCCSLVSAGHQPHPEFNLLLWSNRSACVCVCKGEDRCCPLHCLTSAWAAVGGCLCMVVQKLCTCFSMPASVSVCVQFECKCVYVCVLVCGIVVCVVSWCVCERECLYVLTSVLSVLSCILWCESVCICQCVITLCFVL